MDRLSSFKYDPFFTASYIQIETPYYYATLVKNKMIEIEILERYYSGKWSKMKTCFFRSRLNHVSMCEKSDKFLTKSEIQSRDVFHYFP